MDLATRIAGVHQCIYTTLLNSGLSGQPAVHPPASLPAGWTLVTWADCPPSSPSLPQEQARFKARDEGGSRARGPASSGASRCPSWTDPREPDSGRARSRMAILAILVRLWASQHPRDADWITGRLDTAWRLSGPSPAPAPGSREAWNRAREVSPGSLESGKDGS